VFYHAYGRIKVKIKKRKKSNGGHFEFDSKGQGLKNKAFVEQKLIQRTRNR
jgi:hypothetical protein